MKQSGENEVAVPVVYPGSGNAGLLRGLEASGHASFERYTDCPRQERAELA
jgi:hypothetical protein